MGQCAHFKEKGHRKAECPKGEQKLVFQATGPGSSGFFPEPQWAMVTLQVKGKEPPFDRYWGNIQCYKGWIRLRNKIKRSLQVIPGKIWQYPVIRAWISNMAKYCYVSHYAWLSISFGGQRFATQTEDLISFRGEDISQCDTCPRN